jgi:hypothetical protein
MERRDVSHVHMQVFCGMGFAGALRSGESFSEPS